MDCRIITGLLLLLQDYYKRAELTALLRADSQDEAQRDKPIPMPEPLVSVNSRPRSIARPPKPTRPLPPSPESSLTPYELEQAFRGVGVYQSFRINGRSRSRMDVETFFMETRGSVANLITKELKDLNSAKVQMTARIRFKVEVEDGDGKVIRVDRVDKVFNSQMIEVFKGSN